MRVVAAPPLEEAATATSTTTPRPFSRFPNSPLPYKASEFLLSSSLSYGGSSILRAKKRNLNGRKLRQEVIVPCASLGGLLGGLFGGGADTGESTRQLYSGTPPAAAAFLLAAAATAFVFNRSIGGSSSSRADREAALLLNLAAAARRPRQLGGGASRQRDLLLFLSGGQAQRLSSTLLRRQMNSRVILEPLFIFSIPKIFKQRKSRNHQEIPRDHQLLLEVLG